MKVSNENIWDDNRFKSLKETVGEGAVLLVLIIHLGILFREHGNKEIFAPLGISTEGYEVLFTISASEKTRPSDLSKNTLMHPAKTTRIIDSLNDSKYIERIHDKADRRSYYLKLTEKGNNILKNCNNKFISATSIIKDRLDDKTYNILVNTLYAMMKMTNSK